MLNLSTVQSLDWYNVLSKALACNPTAHVKCDETGHIICNTKDAADTVADLLYQLYVNYEVPFIKDDLPLLVTDGDDAGWWTVPETVEPSDDYTDAETNWYQMIADRLRDFSEGCVWCADGDEILCSTEAGADIIADILESLYLCPEWQEPREVVAVTGYYDPDEDAKAGTLDKLTGWYYISL